MKKLIKIGAKDIIQNYFFLCTVSLINILHVLIFFLPDTFRIEEMIWRYEAFYVIAIALIIPSVMYCRCGDYQREIIRDSIYCKIKKYYSYNLFYYLEVILFLTAGAAAAFGVILFSPNSSFFRDFLFIVHIIMVCCIFIMLYVNLIHITSRYMFASVIYLVLVFMLVLINAPDSYLWFNYGMLSDPKLHWIGKGNILASLSTMYGVIIFIRKWKQTRNK